MIGHDLTSAAWQITPGGHYAQKCECGLVVHGATLPKLYDNHDFHLAAVKAMSMGRHPSRKDDQ